MVLCLQTLFDPINPDKDTVSTRQYNRRERLDNEFWLLQKLAGVMEKANFHELPKATVHSALSEHSTREKVVVSHAYKSSQVKEGSTTQARPRSIARKNVTY